MRSGDRAALVAIAALVVFALIRRPVGTVQTWSSIDLTGIGGRVIYPEGVTRTADAIARAEGFYVSGSIAQRARNPGNLKVPGSTNTINGITVFPTLADGWDALYRQLMLIVTGDSRYYTLDMSIADMGRTWTATTHEQAAWASNVAGRLGVSPSVPLWQVLV